MSKITHSLKSLYRGNLTWLVDNTIIFGRAGSHSYNLAVEGSDFDYKGIVIPSKEYFYGFSHKFEQVERKPDGDNVEFVIYNITKFMSLAAQLNPNILELLYLEPEDYLFVSPIGQKIIDNRDKLLSKKVIYPYLGYSQEQLRKAKLHRGYLLSPPKIEPKRKDFGLPEDKALISRDQAGAFYELIDKNVIVESEVSENFLDALRKEKSYFAAKRQWDQFQDWKKNRNKKRAALEDKCGYDAKNASNLVRLMIQCREIIMKNRLFVKRTDDREFLLNVKAGNWKYEELVEWADKQEVELKELVKTSSLPDDNDKTYLNKLCCELVEEFLGR